MWNRPLSEPSTMADEVPAIDTRRPGIRRGSHCAMELAPLTSVPDEHGVHEPSKHSALPASRLRGPRHYSNRLVATVHPDVAVTSSVKLERLHLPQHVC
jgi:hypothetical protein